MMIREDYSPNELEAADGIYSLQFSIEETYSPDVIQGADNLCFLNSSNDPVINDDDEEEENKVVIQKQSKIVKKDDTKEESSSSNEREEDSSSDERSHFVMPATDNNREQKNPRTRESLIKKPEAVIKIVIKSPEPLIKKQRKARNIIEEDDREETLQLLLQSIKNGEQEIPPPDTIVSKIPNAVAVEFSRCIYKQLTESDVNGGQSRLMLGKKEVKDKFLCLLEESENIPRVEGIDVLVYGPDGESHEMKFKMWIGNTPVLMNGWSKFVKDYGLRKYSDILRIWMFKGSEVRKICFVIDSIRFDDITNQLSKRILKNVFQK